MSNFTGYDLCMSNFIDPVSDLFVKYLLGKLGNEKILLSFINAVLSDYHFSEISEVEIQNPSNIPDIQSGKFSVLDLKALIDFHPSAFICVHLWLKLY